MNPEESNNAAPSDSPVSLKIGDRLYTKPASLRDKRELGAALGGSFSYFFAGNQTAHYTLDGTQYQAVRRCVEPADFIRHLRGESPSLLSIPILQSGNCCFSVLDVDRHAESDPPVDHAALARLVTKLKLPLIVCRSKTPKSAHVYAFFREVEGIPAMTARRILAHWRSILAIPGEVEIFPKQEQLSGDQIGNGLNLPFWGRERIAFGRDGEQLNLDGFLALALERCLYGEILARDLPIEAAGSTPDGGPDAPLTVRTIREIHEKHLGSLRIARPGTRNDTLNSVSFFAGRAFASKALVGDESAIKDAIRNAALSVASNEQKVADTLERGWNSGISRGALELREETEADRAVAEINEKFFIVRNYGNKCRVAWFDQENHPELKGRLKLGHQSFDEFRNSFLNQLVKVGVDKYNTPVFEQKGHLWLRHSRRRQYWRVVFLPEQQVAPDHLNLWRGFAFEPRKGDCGLYLDHLRNIICAGDKDHYDYTLKWMALGVQRPWERGHVALVWRGDKGPGKNLAAEAYGKLFGGHAMTITHAEHLVGRFNSHLRAKCVLIANEAFYAGNKQHEATLKGLITDAVLPIEQKFVDAETDVNLLHIIVLSNNAWVVPASDRERRFFMVDVSDAKIGDFKYFSAIQQQLEAGGYAALLDHLLHVDVTNFNVRNVPKTEALRSQMAESLTGIEAVWFECLQRGEIPGSVAEKDGSVALRGTDLIEWAENKKRRDWHGISVVKLGFLFGQNPRGTSKGMGFRKEQKRASANGERNQAWSIPPLAIARKLWSEKRFAVDWDASVEAWEYVTVRSRDR